MSSRDIKVPLPSWLGMLAHSAIEIYLSNLNKNCYTSPHIVDNYLQTSFQKFKEVYRTPTNGYIYANWSEEDIINWVHGCIQSLDHFLKMEQIIWFKEEWKLTQPHPTGRSPQVKDFGKPDFVGFSKKRKKFLIIDFKTSDPFSKKYIQGDKVSRTFEKKLLKYAAGSFARIQSEVEINFDHTLKADIGLMVFTRELVKPLKQTPYQARFTTIGKRRAQKIFNAFFPKNPTPAHV